MSQPTAEKFFEYDGFWLSKRSDTDKLYITWYDPRTGRTKRKSTRTGDVEQAKHQLIQHAKESKRLSSPDRVPSPNETPIWDALSFYLEKQVPLGHPSRAQTNVACRFFDAFFQEFDLVYISDLTLDVMEEYPAFRGNLSRKWKAARWQKWSKYKNWSLEDIEATLPDIKPATIARDLAVLNAALKLYQRRNKVTRVPFIPRPSSEAIRERWLTPQEFQRLYEAANTQRLKDFIVLAIYTLQRPRFLFDLEVSQVRLNERIIDFLKLGKQQTKKRRPSIRIAEEVVPTLERLIANSKSGYILEYCGKPITTDLRRSLLVAAEKAGLNSKDTPVEDRVVPYTLRHTGATWLAKEGVDLWQISGMLGHKDTQMVQRVYAKHHPDFQAKATATLDRIVPSVGQRASFTPKLANLGIGADFQIPFEPLLSNGSGMVGLRRFELLTSPLSASIILNNYKGLEPFESREVTPDSLGFSDLTRQFHASENGENEDDTAS